ncbi:tyrosine-protein phosphatase 10D isoform X2 [Octopus bimaculoides]|uniref:protein-tyrosine-phosphatase n=2 Tax=Octopus bimaculoides TaxID=37653 RepID=A0A0L8GW14_OCTBM|nr:tyrosine-protein phosphatase 10D isoform X2 [Octopus bimaculoides]|eukprot:XP_014777794.1 PREDICTED: tyrosine-protein phosphatase 10D-like [Octopus bimaculoides]
MEQDDNTLNLQSKTNMIQKTENSQITDINTDSQSNMIVPTTLNKDPSIGETMNEEAINKERFFTKATSSLEENNIYMNDMSMTKENQDLLPTEKQNQITKLSSVQPSTTKAVERKLFALHVTNATETSISVSWNATENIKQFTVSIDSSDQKYNDFVVNTTSTTITNLTCSGCRYNITVKSFYGNNKFSQSINTTNFTVPRMPKVDVIEKPTLVEIKIFQKNQDCNSLKNDLDWEITKSKTSENCVIEKAGLKIHFNYNLTIWRQVDVWRSKKELITIHLREPNAVSDLSHIVNQSDIHIYWQKPKDSKVNSYQIIVTIENPYMHNCTNTTTNMTYYIINDFLPGTQYTVDVYAINYIGTSPKSNIHVTTPSKVPGAVNIIINTITAFNVSISLSRPQIFKGDILGYIVEIYKDKKIPKNKNPLNTYNIRCYNCSQTNAYRPSSCPCSQRCNNMQVKTLHSLGEHFSLDDSLTPFTHYLISARAYTSAGCGNRSQISFATKESAPSKVQSVIINTTETMVYMDWQEPKHPYGKIQYYLIRLYHNNSLIISGNNTEKNFMFENLEPYQNYSVSIVAVNSMSGDKYTQNFRTKIGVPDSVNITIVNTTTKSITIKWKSQHLNGPLRKYVVCWKSVKESTPWSMNATVNTTYTITDLEPYRSYKIKVKIYNTEYWTESKIVRERTEIGVPHPARNITAKAESATSIRVSWEEPMQFTGPTSYIIQGWSLKPSKILKTFLGPFNVSGFHNTSFLVKDLAEYWPYVFEITPSTEAGNGSSINTSSTLTEESTPGPVKSLDIYVNYSCYIALLVTWKKPLPEDENGIITKYEITYWADNDDKKKICVNATLFSTMMIAFGEHSYTIQIRAETSKGLGDTRNKTVYVKPQIPVVPDNVSVTRSYEEVEDSSRQIAINLPSKFFTDFTFGRPVQWGLVIALSDAVKGSDQEHSEIYPRELKEWKEVYDKETAYSYRPTPSDWKPPSILTTKDINAVYILGAQEDCEDKPIYCNGYLKPDRYYRVKAFMCTKGGCSATKYSKPMHTDKDRTAIYITVPVLLVAAIVALNIVFIMWHKKLYCFKKKQIPTVSSLVDANQNGKVNHSFTMKNSEYSRPIMLAHFHSKVEMMKRDTNIQFCEEFKLLKSLSPVQPHVAAELQVNRTKNRYTNILAYDHSRVKLLPMDDDESSDYTNANYIPGYSLHREYIASQGPLPSTKDDFWRMIWEQNVSIIVMVTLPVERGRVKCEVYWPNKSEPVYFGDLVVQLKSESNLSDYVIRIMDVNMGEHTKEVKQFHFLKWPDFGCPQNTSLLINFVQTVRTHMPYMDAGPTLVHCSAGVGRTGTFIAIDRLLQHIQTYLEVDIFGLILELRKYRPNMVQTEDQYVFIYQCIADHLKQMEKIESEGIYMNETGM